MYESLSVPKTSHSASTKFERTCSWNSTAVTVKAICSYMISKYFETFPDADEEGITVTNEKCETIRFLPEQGSPLWMLHQRSGRASPLAATTADFETLLRELGLVISGLDHHAPSASAHTGCPQKRDHPLRAQTSDDTVTVEGRPAKNSNEQPNKSSKSSLIRASSMS